MYDNNDYGKSVSEAQAEFEDSDIWTDQLEGLPVGQSLDNAEDILAHAQTEAHDEPEMPELRPTRAQERQGQRDYDWARDPDLDHPHGMTLAAEERMLGREQEMAQQREHALAAHDADEDLHREASARVQSAAEARQQREDFAARAEVEADRDPETDPREGMDAETLGAINQEARRFVQRYEDCPTAAAVSRRLAEKVEQGKSLTAAVLDVRQALDREAGTIRDIDTLPDDSWVNGYELEADIQGEVQTLYQPTASNQQQVGVISDGTATVKVTVWERSSCGTVLSEGDTVRIRGGKVGYYGGQRTLAVTADTAVHIQERGDGPAPIHGHLTGLTF